MDPQSLAWLTRYVSTPERRVDAGETGHLSRQLEFVKSQTYDVKYPEYMARQLIPVSNEADPGADFIVYRQWDAFGMAKVIANYADDFPRADVLAKEFVSKVKSLGAGYGYSVQDLRRAAFARSRLDEKRALAARRMIESRVDELAAFGMTDAGLAGFVNNANVPVTTATTGAWDTTATADQVVADLNKMVGEYMADTKDVHSPDVLAIDSKSYERLAGLQRSAGSDTTVLTWILATSPHIRSIVKWHKLLLADAGGVGPRAILYKRDPEVLTLEIPQEFEQFPPQAKGMEFEIPCHARHGGVLMYYPLAVRYMDI